jgi:hypothetical protein
MNILFIAISFSIYLMQLLSCINDVCSTYFDVVLHLSIHVKHTVAHLLMTEADKILSSHVCRVTLFAIIQQQCVRYLIEGEELIGLHVT